MGNVLKYEIKKSRFMMLIVGIIIGGLELAYLIGFLVLQQKKKKQSTEKPYSVRCKMQIIRPSYQGA